MSFSKIIKKYIVKWLHKCIIHNTWKVETTQMSIHRQVDRQTIINTHRNSSLLPILRDWVLDSLIGRQAEGSWIHNKDSALPRWLASSLPCRPGSLKQRPDIFVFVLFPLVSSPLSTPPHGGPVRPHKFKDRSACVYQKVVEPHCLCSKWLTLNWGRKTPKSPRAEAGLQLPHEFPLCYGRGCFSLCALLCVWITCPPTKASV